MKVHDIICEEVVSTVAAMGAMKASGWILKTVATRATKLPPKLQGVVSGKIAAIPSVIAFIYKIGTIWQIVEMWLSKNAVLDDMLAMGEINSDEHMQAQFLISEQSAIELLAGTAVSTIITYIGTALTRKTGATLVSVGVNKFLSVGIMTGMTIATIAGSTIGMQKITELLQTNEGQKIIANFVLYWADPSITSVYNAGPGKWWGILKPVTTQAAGNAANKAAQTAATQKTDAQTGIAANSLATTSAPVNKQAAATAAPSGYTQGLSASGNLAQPNSSAAVNAILQKR